jgi:peroxiredoxin
LYALGPESGGRALASAEGPDFTLPDWRGGELTLSSLRGQKVLILSWASW